MTKDEAIELLIIAEEQGDAEALYMLGDECLAKAFSHGVDGDEEWIAIAHDARRAAELAL